MSTARRLCFWPFVDLVCFTLLPNMWIPMAYNVANFFWTIFLSIQASRKLTPPAREATEGG